MDFAQTETLSTTIDTEPAPSAAGGGAVPLDTGTEAKAEQPKSLRDDLEAVFKEDESTSAKADPAKVADAEAAAKDADAAEVRAEEKKAPKPDATKQNVEDVNSEKAPEPEKSDASETKTEEKADGTFREPPKRFLADSREVWRNVPRAVRRDIEAMAAEHEQDIQRFTEVSQRYDRIRDFDELAKSNGRDLRDSLMQVHQFENMMRQNPISALNMALMEVGPRKADGQAYSIYEVAQAIVQQGPEGYQRMMQQAAQPQPQPQENQRVAQLEQQLEEMRIQNLTAQVIEPFKAKHPRYDELSDDIALFLQSGKIPKTLSLHERLAAAYDMAERVNPPSRGYQTGAGDVESPGADRRADPDFSGSKSIKSSPGSVTEEVEDEGSKSESLRDSILKAHRGLRKN